MPWKPEVFMNLYRFEVHPTQLEEITVHIEMHGGQILFSSEGEDTAEIYAHIPDHFPFGELKGVPTELPAIDWEGQWKLHGVNELEINGKQLQLLAGPGFGDFSHPTTQLMIEMMKEHLPLDAVVVDLGCGSGILSLVALALGAKRVIGIDIDPEALHHSLENAQTNGYEGQCTFCLPQDFQTTEEVFVLMNMITSEQKVAWETVKDCTISGIISSGVLRREEKKYSQFAKGWRIVERLEREDWLCFYWSVLGLRKGGP